MSNVILIESVETVGHNVSLHVAAALQQYIQNWES